MGKHLCHPDPAINVEINKHKMLNISVVVKSPQLHQKGMAYHYSAPIIHIIGYSSYLRNKG